MNGHHELKIQNNVHVVKDMIGTKKKKMGKIFEAADLPEAEKIYLKKDKFGWAVIHPAKNPETGKINWFNLLCGGVRNFAYLIIFILFVLGFFYIYYHDTSEMQKVVEDPCSYCSTLELTDVYADTMKNFVTVNQEIKKMGDINLSGYVSNAT